MRILFLADVVGKPGRAAIERLVPDMRREEGLDLVVANGENAARGLGITPRLARGLLRAGVDVLTSGNHLFRHREIVDFIKERDVLLRPHNWRTRAPGKGWVVAETEEGQRVGILNLCGQQYMEPTDDPVAAAEEILSGPLADIAVRVLDFHAEATGEKRGLFKYLDGRVSLMAGTHTHVQTADEQISPRGTAYITDAGITGPVDGVIGMEPECAIQTIRTGLPQRYAPASGASALQGVIVEVEHASGRATGIERVDRRIDDDAA